jgi:hypothetical protein
MLPFGAEADVLQDDVVVERERDPFDGDMKVSSTRPMKT